MDDSREELCHVSPDSSLPLSCWPSLAVRLPSR